jgi:hypothetical protein
MNRRWYAFSIGVQKFDRADFVRAYHPGASTMQLYARIAALPRVLGERLDELRAPLRIFQLVAFVQSGPGVPEALVRQTRFREAIAFFEKTNRWPCPWEIRDLRRRVEERLGLRRAEEHEHEQPDERDGAEEQEKPPAAGEGLLTAEELAAALDGRAPVLARLIEQFADLRRRTA